MERTMKRVLLRNTRGEGRWVPEARVEEYLEAGWFIENQEESLDSDNEVVEDITDDTDQGA